MNGFSFRNLNEIQDWRTNSLKNIRNLIVPTNNKPVNTMIIKSRVSLPVVLLISNRTSSFSGGSRRLSLTVTLITGRSRRLNLSLITRVKR